ncbi:pleckstrin homology (PH) domain-containing protein [Actinidia rufa]|uniref:Pleckstrin homology (PH) domain-containing protein n=1 Tax=Actinidia rufa TaxID=165716 RepID=A0A7J0D7V7_9ERIC|nr:pleckstrin homology (PH) domain-containing protein [Actinidia rufa]
MLEDQVAYLLQRFDYSFVTSSSQSLSSRKFGSLSYVGGDSGPCVKSSVLNHPAFARPEVILFSRSHSRGFSWEIRAQEMGFTAFKAMSIREVRSWGHVTWGCDFPGYFMQDQRSIGDSGPCVKSSILNPPAFAQPEVPWSRLGQDPVLVSLDCIFLLAKPATQVQGCSEDTIQEVKKKAEYGYDDMEMKLLESRQVLKMTPQAMGRTSVEVVYELRLDFGLCLELLDKGIDSITCKKILR